MGLFNTPKGPKTKYPAGCPMAALACAAYCSGVSPVSACTLLTLITALAGMGACPGATTRLSLSTPINGNEGANGHFNPAAVIWASVRLLEKHPPGRPTKRARLETKDGDP